MAEPAIDASPLIFLARSGWLDLLRIEGTSVVVPSAVASELRARGPDDPAARALSQQPWLRVAAPLPIPTVVQARKLGPGESAVLAWCQAHRPAVAILDDLSGRRAAEDLGIPVRGTLGLVLVAKRRGILAAARPVLEDLVAAGMYLSPKILDQALATLGE